MRKDDVVLTGLPAQVRSTPIRAPHSHERTTVINALVVSSDMATTDELQQLLSMHRIATKTAYSLAQALMCIGRERFDLMLIDQVLSDGDGFTLAHRLLAHTNDIAVVLLSASRNVDNAVAAIRMDVADYVLKPFEPEQLMSRIGGITQRILRNRRQKRSIEALQSRNAELQAMVTRDGLTGLYNRRCFMETLEREVSRCSRHHQSVGLIFVDVDHFKMINDSRGHPVGDRALCGVAGIMAGLGARGVNPFRLRRYDLAARYGGDEFVILMHEISKEDLRSKAELLRHTIERARFADSIPQVTVSVGVASFPEDASDAASLIAAADAATYAAKRRGRNSVAEYVADAPVGECEQVLW